MQFLELSLVTPDIGASLEFYRRLGFAEAAVGDAWSHPYAVVSDGRICVGLHGDVDFEPSVTFVKPGLLGFLDTLEPWDLPFEFRRIAGDVFNEVGWRDPSGTLIRVVEARTFSPPERRPTDSSMLGYFLEIALPAGNRDAAKDHWERFGFVGIDEPDGMLPHVSCTSDGIDIGLYEPAHVRAPTLMFEVADLSTTLGGLRAAGILPQARLPAPLRNRAAAVVSAPEGTAILLAAPAPRA